MIGKAGATRVSVTLSLFRVLPPSMRLLAISGRRWSRSSCRKLGLGAALSMWITDAAGGPVYFGFSAGGPDDRVSEISDELELSPLNSRPVGQDLFPGLFSF
jgi:hypothetical protein